MSRVDHNVEIPITLDDLRDPTAHKLYLHEKDINKLEFQINSLTSLKELNGTIEDLIKTHSEILILKKKANASETTLQATSTKFEESVKSYANICKETLTLINAEKESRKNEVSKFNLSISAINELIDKNSAIFTKSSKEIQTAHDEDLIKVAATLKTEINSENHAILHSLYHAHLENSTAKPQKSNDDVVTSYYISPYEFICPVEDAIQDQSKSSLISALAKGSIDQYKKFTETLAVVKPVKDTFCTTVTKCLNSLSIIANAYGINVAM